MQPMNAAGGNCSFQGCAAPDVSCHLGNLEFSRCEHFKVGLDVQADSTAKQLRIPTSVVPWSGDPLEQNGIDSVTSRANPFLVSLVGAAGAGKTTFLGMLFALLLSGKQFEHYRFAGSKTLSGWDLLVHELKSTKSGVNFSPPTPVQDNLIYHLCLRNMHEQFIDLLFCDASGEVFSLWAENREDVNAGIARWVYQHSAAFLLFIDCEALKLTKNIGKQEVLRMARQLSHDFGTKTILAVWSKGDVYNEVLPELIDETQRELKALFPNIENIIISNYQNPGPAELVYKNNVVAIDLILKGLTCPHPHPLEAKSPTNLDYFLGYRMRE